MQVVTQNAEDKLLSALKECWEKFPTHRCLVIQSTGLKASDTETLGLLVKNVYLTLEDKALQIYMCKNSDVFIISRFLRKKHIEEILSFMSPKLAPGSSSNLASLYDIGADWITLNILCKSRFEDEETYQDSKKNKDDLVPEIDFLNEDVSLDHTLDKVNQKLLESLKKRRSLRKESEIMIVEDDIFSQNLVKNILHSKYNVFSVDDGFGSILNYAKRAPDILFLDIGLPDTNGHDVLKKIFEMDSDAFVVMLSGHGDRDNVLKAIELGAKGFISKPFTREKILHYIEKSPFIQAKLRKDNLNGNSVC